MTCFECLETHKGAYFLRRTERHKYLPSKNQTSFKFKLIYHDFNWSELQPESRRASLGSKAAGGGEAWESSREMHPPLQSPFAARQCQVHLPAPLSSGLKQSILRF